MQQIFYYDTFLCKSCDTELQFHQIYILFGVDSVRLCYSMFTVVQSSVRVTDSRQFLMLSLYQIFVLILILSVCQQQIGRWIFLLFRLTCQYNFFFFFCLSNLDNVIFIPSRLSHKIFPLEAAGQPSEPVWCLVICIPCNYCHQ